MAIQQLNSNLIQQNNNDKINFPVFQYFYEKYDQFPEYIDLSESPFFDIQLLNTINEEFNVINKYSYYRDFKTDIFDDDFIDFFNLNFNESSFNGNKNYNLFIQEFVEKDGLILKIGYFVGSHKFDDETPKLRIYAIFGKDNQRATDYLLSIDKYKTPVSKKDNTNIYSIIEVDQKLKEKSLVFIPDEVSIEDNYNDDFLEFHDKLVNELRTGKKGLYLFYGEPGTGKTKLVTKLALEIGKKIFFLPSHMASILTSPHFIPFILDHKNSIILIEEAENSLINIHGERNPAVSNILNLTDGILADALNIQIICTFNTQYSKIDPALTRKGRLKMQYEFKKLSMKKSNKLLKKLGFDHITTEPMTLADIYNFEQELGEINKPKNKIGF